MPTLPAPPRALLYALLLALTLFAACALAQDSTPVIPLTPAQEVQAQAIGGTLRCPVCQGLPITESTSDLSHQMLRELRSQVARGESREQIVDYFAARYGNTVLLDPPRRGANLLLWAAPLLALAAGAFWLLGYLRRGRGTPAPAPAEAPQPEADPYLRRVRAETGRAGAGRGEP